MPHKEQVRQTIIAEFKEVGSEGVEWGLNVAQCESGYQPYISNHTNGKAKGLFQFMVGTFYANAARAGIENPDIWNWRQQVKVAKYMYSIGQKGQWECTGLI